MTLSSLLQGFINHPSKTSQSHATTILTQGACGGAPISIVRQSIEQQQTPH
ncbi:hypothetical protein LptCag_0480 [Leptospirillum ferriphilum]|uniref:Uncharacterized protein n=1 Tax=Leptospirillum ferriphilum TaxID=178606 RepID=A0A094W8D4_9BACT|nr:hypothetical protein LptCag_0480 [Leptospirillum ferriphilum]